MRDGNLGSVTTASPRAASVGASRIASTIASVTLNWLKSRAASSVPSAMVSGSPIPSSRSGTAYSRRSRRGLIRDASAKSTTASVASASVRTPSLAGAEVTPSSTSGPTTTPTATNTIAAVTGVPVSRREIAATANAAAAMIASSHFIRSQDRFCNEPASPG
jgi:hypothetical protein